MVDIVLPAQVLPDTQKQQSSQALTNTLPDSNEFKWKGQEFLTANTTDKPADLR